MQEVLERKDSSHDSSSAGTRTEQRRNGGASTPLDRATTCENGITHAAFQWEKQAGYISSPSRSRPTDRPRPASSSPPRGGGAASSDTRRDCDCERRAASGERPLCACFDFNPRHSSHRVDAVDGEVPKVHPTIYIADFLLLSRPRSNRNLTKGNTRFIEVLFLGEPLCGFGFIFNPRVRGRLGDWGGEPIMGKGSCPSRPPLPCDAHSLALSSALIPSFLPSSVGLGPF